MGQAVLVGKSFWTPEEDATLRELTAEGHSSSEIGRRMDKTKGSIISRQHRLLIRSAIPPPGKGPAWTEEEIVRLLYLIAGGYHDPEIAKALKKTTSSVRNRRTRMGIRASASARRVRPPPSQRKMPPVFINLNLPEVVPLKVSLLDLRRRHCRFVCDEKDADGLYFYCGHPVVHGTSWCPGHSQLVYLHPERRSFLQAAE